MDDVITYFPVVALVFFVLFFGVVLPRHRQSFYAKLRAYYHGVADGIFGDLEFSYAPMVARISRVSSGRGGHFLLWTYVNSGGRIIIGHPQSARYRNGKFLILPPHKNLNLSSMQVLVGADNPAVIEKIEKNFDSPKFNDACVCLFNEKFNYLTISSELHFDNFLPSKKWVLRYQPLVSSVFSNPEEMKPYMDAIVEICSVLDVNFQSN